VSDAEAIEQLRGYAEGKHPASECPTTAGEIQAIFLALAASRREVAALRDALRAIAIADSTTSEPRSFCKLCMGRWLRGDGEAHAPGCLAALTP